MNTYSNTSCPQVVSSCFIYSKSCRVTSRSDRNFGSAHRMALPLDFTAARTMERSFPQGPWRQCAMTSCVSHWRDTVDFTMLRKSKQFSHVYFWALRIIYINYRIITKTHLWVWRIFDFCTNYLCTRHHWTSMIMETTPLPTYIPTSS